MENTTTETVDESKVVDTEKVDETTVDTTKETETENTETVSMSKIDYDKAIQSAGDKVRTTSSKEIKTLNEQIKVLEDKVKGLIPVEKSEAELAIEKARNDNDDRQKNLDAKEKHINLITALQSKNIDNGFADYIKDDIDIDSFEGIINNFLEKSKGKGYVPTGHIPNEGITKEQYNKLTSYEEKLKVYNANPELIKKY